MRYLPGIDVLVRDHRERLMKSRVGLVAHPASVNADGIPTPDFLREAGIPLACVMGPEHGFLGKGGAGEEIGHQRHAEWDIPVYSLYGDTRKPTSDMLAGLDVILFDLQDLGARPYTYGSTLRYVLEAAAEHDLPVLVADRPIPYPQVFDGPMREDAFESFVGFIRTPVEVFPERAVLYRRIDLRVDKMLEAGLIKEAEHVWQNRESFRTAAQAIGYKEFFPYFEQTAPLEACTEKLKQASRNYAKRQLTWFRHMDGVVWLDAGAPDAVQTAIRKTSEFLAKG